MVSSTGHAKCSDHMEKPPVIHAPRYDKRLQGARQKREQRAEQRRVRREREQLQRE